MKGWYEEVYFSYYKIGQAMVQLKKPWLEVMEIYLECYNRYPHRMEPIYEIANHYRIEEKWHLCYQFAKIGQSIPYPKNDVLFVTKAIYDYKLLDVLSIGASWIGKYHEASDIANNLLNSGVLKDAQDLSGYSTEKRIRENLSYFLTKK
jgi:hypothetical protein